ncbi:S8 family serine peptidase [Propionibacteriaceae bacterium G1746]|uniref:S8 family serine peptidase n=1 Tax=Aestuariimicrobium sp. G57 TaxID=3418485 RepID=UPI003C17E91C
MPSPDRHHPRQQHPVRRRGASWAVRATAAVTLVGMAAVGATAPQAHAADPLEVSLCRAFQPLGNQGNTAWQMDRLHLREAWTIATGKGVSIAVIDTGTSNVNSAYFNANDVKSFNMVPIDDQDRKDGLDCGHGTQVTSLIASTHGIDARTNFGGVAPDATVLAYRALAVPIDQNGNQQSESPAATVAAINEAIKAKVRIINISQAMGVRDAAYEAAIARAIAAGIVVVAAAGNTDMGLTGPAYPAAYPGVIAVGATRPDDTPSEVTHSATGMQVTVAAPGELVTALNPSMKPAKTDQASMVANQAYVNVTGTSFAAPLVTGVVALLLEKEPNLTPAQVKQRLIETADRPVATPPDPKLGWGVVNPVRALVGTAVPTSSHPSPTVPETPTPPPAEAPVDPRPQRFTLAAAAGALGLAGLALTLKLVIPAAAKRDFAPAEEPRDEDEGEG